MDRTLLWSAFALGWVGWLFAVFLGGRDSPPRNREAPSRGPLALAAALPFLLFLASLPGAPPWSPGQGFGKGFLLGGVSALLAAWASWRLAAASGPASAAARLTAHLFLASSAAAGSLLFLRAEIVDTLLGIAIAWMCEALVLRQAVDSDDGLAAGPVFAAALCGTAALGVYREGIGLAGRSWSAAVPLSGVMIPLAWTLASLPAPFVAAMALRIPFAGFIARLSGRLAGAVVGEDAAKFGAITTWRIGITGLLALLTSWLIAGRLLGEPHVWHAALVGVGAGLLLLWLVAEPSASEPPSGVDSIPRLLRALTLLAGFMVGYKLLAGYGAGMAFLAAFAVSGLGLLPPSGSSRADRSALFGALAFGTILTLYRLFTSRFSSELHGAKLDDNYALFGLLVGAALPAVAAGFLSRGEADSGGARTMRLVLCGAMLLGVPAVITLIWGAKCALALMFGLAASAALGARPGARADSAPIAPLFALAAALALAQWMQHALPLASLARAQKVEVLAVVVAVLVAAALFAEYAGRIGRHRASGPEGAPR